MRPVLALCILLAPFSQLDAGCTVYRSYSTPYVEQVVVKKVQPIVAVEYLALPVVIPAYAVGYAPTAPAAPLTAPCEEKVRSLEERLRLLESRPPQAPAPQSVPPMGKVGKSLIVGKCASCHDASRAAERGKGLILTDQGSVLKLSPDHIGRMLREVSQGKMPKGSKLTEEEFNSFLQELVDLQGK